MMRQRRQLYALGNVLSRRFHMCSIEVKNTLFRSFCTPMYTCQSWWNFSAQSMHKLNVAYNNAFRFMHHLPTYCSASLMFVVNRVTNCRAVIRNRIYGFMKRLVYSSNALVLSAVTIPASTITIRQPKPNRWFNVGPTATYLVGPTLLCSLDTRCPNINRQP